MKKLFLIYILLHLLGLPLQAQNQHIVDSLENLLKKHNSKKAELGIQSPSSYDTNAISILNHLFQVSWKNLPDKAIEYANQLLKLSEQIGYKIGIGEAYNYIGIVKMSKGDYLLAMEFYKKSLKIREEIGNKQGLAAIHNSIANIYYHQGNYVEALKIYLTVLKIYEESNDKFRGSALLNNIGSIYLKLGNYPEALKNYTASLKLKEEIGNKRGIAVTYSNIAGLYVLMGNDSVALKNYFAAIKIDELLSNRNNKAYCYNDIGEIYYRQGNKLEALKYQLDALKIFEDLGDKNGIAVTNRSIGGIYCKEKRYIEASEYLNKSLSLSKEIGSLEDIKNSYEGLATLDSARGNFKEAFKYYKMFIAARDSLVNEENTKKTVQLQMQYEFDKKETEYKLSQQISAEKLKQQKQELALTTQELQLRRNALELSIKEKDLQKLAYLKQMAELEKEKLRVQDRDKLLTIAENEKLLQASKYTVLSQVKALQETQIKTQTLQSNGLIAGSAMLFILLLGVFYIYRINQSKKFLEVRNKIARDLHDDVGATLSSISLYSEAAKNYIEKNEHSKAEDIIKVIGNNSRSMIDDMADIVWAVNPDNDDFDKLISRLQSHGASLFGVNGTAFYFNAHESLKDLQLNMTQRKNLYLICKEALNNTAKYAMCSKSYLSFIRQGNELMVSIKDNGKGFDPNNGNTGNGLKNMKSRAEEMMARILISSAEGAGTEITLNLKIT